MKKLALLLIVALLCMSLFACGADATTPTGAANGYLAALKANDSDKLAEFYAGNVDDIAFNDLADTDDDVFDQKFKDQLLAMFLEFKYDVSNEVITDDKATVDATIQTYTFGNAFKEAMAEVFTQALPLALSGASDEEINELMTKIMKEKIEAAKFEYKETVTLALTKVDDKWVVDEIDEESAFMNAISGGLLDFANGMTNAFGGE